MHGLVIARIGGLEEVELGPLRGQQLGIELDDQDRPKPGAEPRVESIEISGDGAELLRMSRRHADSHGSTLRLDRLASDHPVFRQVLKAIVESATTSEEMRPEDFDGANEAITSTPAPSGDLKGKVVDVVENGYTLNDKVIRFAKVIVGE